MIFLKAVREREAERSELVLTMVQFLITTLSNIDTKMTRSGILNADTRPLRCVGSMKKSRIQKAGYSLEQDESKIWMGMSCISLTDQKKTTLTRPSMMCYLKPSPKENLNLKTRSMQHILHSLRLLGVWRLIQAK